MRCRISLGSVWLGLEEPGIGVSIVSMESSDVVKTLAVSKKVFKVFVGSTAGGAGVVRSKVGCAEHVAGAEGVGKNGGQVVVELVWGIGEGVREDGFDVLKEF